MNSRNCTGGDRKKKRSRLFQRRYRRRVAVLMQVSLEEVEVGDGPRGVEWVKIVRPAVVWVVLAIVLIAAFVGGVKVRRWAWDVTTDQRFIGDIGSGYEWGTRA